MVRLIKFSLIHISRIVIVGLCLVAASSVHGLAQDASQRPANASEVVAALERSRWQMLSDGLLQIQVDTALGRRLTALRIDAEKYKLAILAQIEPKGERASNALERSGAELVVNGGFFSIDTDGVLKPVGALILDGQALSRPWSSSGGYLSLDENGVASITPTHQGSMPGFKNAVQSKPVLIEPGGIWAMNTNGTELERRTLLCLLRDGSIILALVHGSGMTLFESGWVLRSREWGGYFGCDSAIALDGGGSTQLAVRDHDDLSLTGLTRVQNFLAVIPRTVD